MTSLLDKIQKISKRTLTITTLFAHCKRRKGVAMRDAGQVKIFGEIGAVKNKSRRIAGGFYKKEEVLIWEGGGMMMKFFVLCGLFYINRLRGLFGISAYM